MAPRVTIESIEVAGPDRRARRLVFCEVDAPRTTAGAVVKALSLAEGMCFPAAELEAELTSQEALQARERALRLLAYRERSPHELKTRLVNDGYPIEIAAQIVDRFTELELVDESRFASLWAAGRAAAGVGTRRIRRELSDRGVGDSTIEAAVTPIEEGELQRAMSQLQGRVATSRKDRDRLLRRLVTRGFEFRVAREAVDRVSKNHSDEQPFISE